MVLNKIKNTERFTSTEKIIADFIIEYPRAVLNLSLKELSENLYISQSSIIRFCKKVNVNGFSDLKVQLASDLAGFIYDDKILSSDFPIAKEDTPEEITSSFLNLGIQTLQFEKQHMDLEKITSAAKLIHQSDIIYLYGRGESLIIAEDIHYKLIRIGITSVLQSQNSFSESQTFKSNNNSRIKKAALVISNYGNSQQMLSYVDELVVADIPIIFLTGSKNHSPLNKIASITLNTHSNENRFKMGSFESRYSMNYILDCMFGILFSFDYDENKKILYEMDKRNMKRNYFS